MRALFISYRIETTVEKAKEARKLADKMITFAKKGNLSGIRAIEKVLQDRALTSKIVKELTAIFKDRKGGYTRIIRTGFRRGDGAQLAILELTEQPVKEEKAKKPKKEKQAQVQPEAIKETESKKEKEVKPKPSEKPKDQPKKQAPTGKKGVLGKFRGMFKNKKGM